MKKYKNFQIPELFAPTKDLKKLKIEAANLVSWDLTQRQCCDLELLMNGGFYPLNGFLNEKDYFSVLENMRMADNSLWPIPINLDVSKIFAKDLKINQKISLRDPEGVILAILEISDIYTPNKEKEAELVFGTNDIAHPSVNYLHNKAGDVYLGGKIIGIQPVVHYDFRAIRDTPNELRSFFQKVGWDRIVAFQTRNPLHRAHQELTFKAAKEAQANLLIHPVVGMGKPGDIDHFTRVRCYEAVINQYPATTTSMSLLNLAMRMAGPREAIWHGLIRKNHGCTHLIIGRDHAGPGKDSNGDSFYGPYDAQKLFKEYEDEMGIEMVDFKHMVFLGEMNKALSKSRADVGKHTPKMEQITVDKKDIAAVIGKGGATIREIVEKSGAKIDVNDEGVVTVAAPDEESRNIAMQIIKDITAKAELNKIYSGKVMKIMWR